MVLDEVIDTKTRHEELLCTLKGTQWGIWSERICWWAFWKLFSFKPYNGTSFKRKKQIFHGASLSCIAAPFSDMREELHPSAVLSDSIKLRGNKIALLTSANSFKLNTTEFQICAAPRYVLSMTLHNLSKAGALFLHTTSHFESFPFHNHHYLWSVYVQSLVQA